MNMNKLQKYLSEKFSFKTNPKVSSEDWIGPYELPQELIQFYLDLQIQTNGYIFLGFGNAYFLPSLRKLYEHQDRWVRYTDPENINELWKENWLVIASQAFSPFVYDTKKTKIYFEIRKNDKAVRVLFCNNPYELVWCLVLVSHINTLGKENYLSEYSKYNFYAVYYNYAYKKLSKTIDDEKLARSMLKKLGYNTPKKSLQKFDCLDLLLKLSKDDDCEVRADVALALSMFENKKSFTRLTEMKKDKDSCVRDQAKVAIKAQGYGK